MANKWILIKDKTKIIPFNKLEYKISIKEFHQKSVHQLLLMGMDNSIHYLIIKITQWDKLYQVKIKVQHNQ
jgi:hypothetical protein